MRLPHGARPGRVRKGATAGRGIGLGAGESETCCDGPALPGPAGAGSGDRVVLLYNEGRVTWDVKARGPRTGYYYRAIRVGGRVKKLYVGGGAVGEAAALADRRRREIKLTVKREEATLAAADERLDDLY